MFCTKCGTKASDGDKFCQKCGAKLINDMSATQPTPESYAEPVYQSGSTPTEAYSKKKSRKLPIIIGAVIMVALAAIFIAINWEGEINCVATVKAHQPFNKSQGIPFSYVEVLDDFLVSPTWTGRAEGDIYFVDIVGKTKEPLVCSMSITIAVSDTENDIVQITPKSITIDGTVISDKDDVTKILFAMFSAKDEGLEDISEVLIVITGKGAISNQEYVNESERISFSYPDFWVMDDSFVSEDEGIISFFSQMIPYTDCFNSAMQIKKFPDCPDRIAELYIPDDEFAAIWDSDATVYEASLIEQGGVFMRKIVYSEPTDTVDDCFYHCYLYAVGNDLYRVDFIRVGEITKNLDNIFDEVMRTYTIRLDNRTTDDNSTASFGFPVTVSPPEYAKPEPVEFSRGTISYDGKTYTSDYLGITFTLPEGWSFFTDSQIAETMNVGEEIAFENGVAEANETIEQATIYDMMALSETGETNVLLMFENLSLIIGGTSMTEMDYVNAISEQLSALGSIEYQVAELTEKQLAGDTYTVLGFSIPAYGTYQEYYIRCVDDYMLALIFTGTSDPASSGVDVHFTKK